MLKGSFPIGRFAQQRTPFYYYDLDLLRRTLTKLREASSCLPAASVHYAVKANFNPVILKEIAAAGLGADCVSGGEIKAALAAGFPASGIVYAGVGKSDEEIRFALAAGISRFNVESAAELEVIEEIAAEMDAAHRYNYSLFNNAVVLTDPFDPDAYPITDGNYDELLATDDIMAFVEIPAIKVNLPIYHHTTEDVLVKGVGHLENTSLPVGGESTHAVLSAHCGLPSAKLFTDLHLLKVDNIIKIHVLDETLFYKVNNIEVVLPDDSSSLHIIKGRDIITLITCTPYGKNTHRLLVHAERTEGSTEKDIEEPSVDKEYTWQDYAKLAAIIISVIFVAVLAAGGIKSKIKRRKKKNEEKTE